MDSVIDEKTFLESIYYGAGQAIFVIDVTKYGDFIFAGLNPAHEKATGFESEYIKGKPLITWFRIICLQRQPKL